MGIALSIVDAVAERVGDARVTRVRVEVGMLAAVLPDALRFSFALASEGTPLEGATLEILEEPGRARCRACAREIELVRPFGRCECGQTELDWLSGDQLLIRDVEVDRHV